MMEMGGHGTMDIDGKKNLQSYAEGAKTHVVPDGGGQDLGERGRGRGCDSASKEGAEVRVFLGVARTETKLARETSTSRAAEVTRKRRRSPHGRRAPAEVSEHAVR
jgi:hypothetical protein